MKKYFNIIKKSPLFSGVSDEELEIMLKCLSASIQDYSKGQFILRSGDNVSSVGMVLSGSVHIIKEDFWGNRNIISASAPGQLFAETYAFAHGAPLNVSAVAEEPSTVLFFDAHRILTVCSSACGFHTKLIRNLLSVFAEKNLILNEKLTHMTQRTTREKLLSYLSSEAVRHGSPSFEIPFNRQQLADYLSVDRSSMSNELCKMRDEGILSFKKNSFVLKTL
ncbi:MAG: Crp/Fnr family transcriptional regulator [Clostridiales bacterium]|nr:Crp/Fnr family transcriptional regulator [Clostridiales bacterium]